MLPIVITIGVLLLPMCSNCETPAARKTYAVMRLLLILIVFIAISGYSLVTNGREFFIDHFDEYRCEPWFMPFVKWVRPDVDTAENMKKCAGKKTSMLIGLMAVPLVNVTKSLGTGMNQTSKSVNIMSKSVQALAGTISSKIEHSNKEVNRFQAMALYMFLKCKAIFDKVGAMVFNFYYAFISITDLINLVLMLPEILIAILAFFMLVTGIVMAAIMIIGVIITAIGTALAIGFFTMAFAPPKFALAATYFVSLGISIAFFAVITAIYVIMNKLYKAADRHSYCCFGPNTRVIRHDGSTVRIADLRIKDRLLGNTRVQGILTARSTKRDWCLCGSTLVSADHTCWDASRQQWVRTGDLYPRTHRSVLHRYCLVTSTRVIPTVDGWFSDFQEMAPATTEMVQHAQSTLADLNATEPPLSKGKDTHDVIGALEYGEMQMGFEPDTEVTLHDRVTTKQIQHVRIGDRLACGGHVLGTYCVDITGAIGARTAGGTWIPCDQIILRASGGNDAAPKWKKWYTVSNTEMNTYHHHLKTTNKKATNTKTTRGYHLITEHGVFRLSRANLDVRDLTEIPQRVI